MVEINPEEFLWEQKYRPKKIVDCILPDSMKKFFASQVKNNQIQNMLFCGSHGTGKTTAARAIANEIGADVLFINCSKDNGIEQMRTKISNVATTRSLIGKPKIVIADEFDYFSPNGQAAARGIIEEVSANCRFIITCNYPNKIIEPLRSRLVIQDFTIDSSLKPELAKQFFIRCCEILDQEGIKYDKKSIADFILLHFPDYRKLLGELQRASMQGEILTTEVLCGNRQDIQVYIEAIKKKDFQKARRFITEMNMSPTDLISEMFNSVYEIYKDHTVGNAILILNEYQYKNGFVVNPVLNLTAMTIELMAI